MKRLAILLSGRGSNFSAIANAIETGKLAAQVAVVISNKPEAGGLEKARALGIAAVSIPSKGVARETYDQLLLDEIRKHNVDLICLAGYMRVLSPVFIRAFPQQILNIHPSLLPAFPGLDAQQQAFDHGVRIAGCTVHFVDEGLDSGPIIQQASVNIESGEDADTLSARILKEEHRIYSQAIGKVLAGGWRIEGRRVIFKKSDAENA